MATSQLDTVFQHLRRIVLIRDGAGLTDRQLLESFISQRDEAAFEALVRRLGPMVLKVCRRVVGNHHDAEDAFQATFLVLARKASSVKSRDMLANWLHGVALRTALKARTLRLKTQARERHVSNPPEPEAATPDDSHALKPLLDQELSRLAEIYRLPILLCNLEGKSIKETAQQLGWPQGTVAGRLARGKIILAKRLARHGLATTAGVTVLENSLSACVPPSLVASTIKAASVYAAGKSAATGMIAANVAVLMEGVLKAMFFTKIKIAAGVLVVGSVIALGGGVLVSGTAEGQQTEGAKSGEIAAKQQPEPSKGKADAGKKDATTPKTEHDKFRGTWRVIEWNSHGNKDIPLQMSRWSIGKYRIVMNPALLKTTKSPTPSQYASYQFWGDHDDAAPAANNINMTIGMVVKSHDGKEDGISQQTYRGIFEWDGDRLRLCFRQLVFGTRPTAIPVSPSKDDNLLIVVLKRETAAPTTDEEKLQGDWKIVSGEVAGESIETTEASIHMSFVGDLMICPEEETDSTFQLDATKNPKQIIATCKFGKVERRIAGIYSLDGDELKFCLSKEKDAPPPNDFTAAKGSGRQMFVLKRVKSAGEGVTAPQVRADGNRNPKPLKADLSKYTANAGKKDGATAKSYHDKLRGTWRVVEMKGGGKGESVPKDFLWSIGKNKIVMTFALKLTEPASIIDRARVMTYRLSGGLDDSAPSPHGIDLTRTSFEVGNLPVTASDMVQNTVRGIFAIEGDRLKVCIPSLLDAERPTNFTTPTSKNNELQIVVLQRETAIPKTDEQKLQGEWKVVRREVDGKRDMDYDRLDLPKEADLLSFVGDLFNSDEKQFGSCAYFRLDSTKTPKAISVSFNRRKMHGIYFLDGDDLKICFQHVLEGPRPDAFSTTKDSGRDLLILKRVKSTDGGVTAPQGRADPNPYPMQRQADRSKDKTAQPPKSAMTDWERIQGIWELVSEESEGKARKFEKTVLMVDGKAVCIQTAGDGDIMVGLHLDPTHDPKTFELVMNTQTREGIYELDGDILRLCGDVGHEPKRPTRFATEPGSHQSLVVFKRLHGREVFPYPRADGRSRFPEIVARRKSDHFNLPGTWLVTELHFGGTKRAVPDMRWFIGKDKIVISQADHVFGWPAKEGQEATYQFWGDNGDAAPSPYNINMSMEMVNESPHAASRLNFRGVFQVDGDKLKLCFRQRSLGARPTTIPSTSSKGDNLLIVVLERQTAAPKTDEEKIQGDWKLVAEEAEGKRDDEADHDSEPEIFSFVGDLMIWKSEEEQEAVFNLDSAKSPKHITTIYKPNGVERKMLGIYSLNGDDLIICFQHVEKEGLRPDAFTTVKGSGRQIFILKRMKPAAEGAAPAQAPRIIDASKKTARAERVCDHVDGGGQGILIALYDELKSGCLDLKKANCEIWAQEVKDGRIIRPVVVHRDGQGRNELISMAEEGELKVDAAKGTLAIALFKVVIITRAGDHAYCESRTMSLGSIDDAR